MGADCENYLINSSSGPLRISRPAGYVDICADRSERCIALTAGFPPSVETLAYFVLPKELHAAQTDNQRLGFSRYYIVQLSRQSHAADYPIMRNAIREKNGNLVDSTQLPKSLGQMRVVRLGVLDETESSITIGVLMRPEGERDQLSAPTIATNSIVLVGANVFSLYFYDDYKGEKSLGESRQLTRDWVACFHAGRK